MPATSPAGGLRRMVASLRRRNTRYLVFYCRLDMYWAIIRVTIWWSSHRWAKYEYEINMWAYDEISKIWRVNQNSCNDINASHRHFHDAHILSWLIDSVPMSRCVIAEIISMNKPSKWKSMIRNRMIGWHKMWVLCRRRWSSKVTAKAFMSHYYLLRRLSGDQK